MLRKRQQQQQQQQPCSSPGPSALDSWVTSDSHFVPARQGVPSSVAPPSRPPPANASSVAASLLGFGRRASGAGDYAPKRSGACVGSDPADPASAPSAISCSSGSSAHLGDVGSGSDHTATDSPSQHMATAATAAAISTHHSRTKQSPGGGGGQDPWEQRLDCVPYAHASSAAAAAAAAGMTLGRTSAAGDSPAASRLPETPSLRSPEWSPRRRSRSSGSAPSASPLLAVASAAPTPTQAVVSARMLPPPAPPPQGSGLGFLYDRFSGHGRDGDGHASGKRAGGGGSGGAGSPWVKAAGGLGWRGLPQLAEEWACEGGEEGWKDSGGGEGGGGDGGERASCVHAPVRGPLGESGMARGAPAEAAAAAVLLGPDPGDLSFVLGMLDAVRCVANAARAVDAAGGGGAAVSRGSQPSTAGSGLGGYYNSNRHNNSVTAVTVTRSDLASDSSPFGGGSRGLPRQPLGSHAVAAAADSSTITAAAVAAPTSVLLLVLAVRLFRAAMRWPAAVSLCAAVAAVLAAWLATATALFTAAGAAGRTVHLLGRIAWAVVAFCLGSKGPAATPGGP